MAGATQTGQMGSQRPGPTFLEKIGHDRWLRFWLLAPVVLILALFSIYPLIYALYTSLFNYNKLTSQMTTFAGLDNYIKLLGDDAFWNSIRVTLFFAAVVVITELVFGL